MRGIDLTKLAIGGALAAVLATTACGGDSTDQPAAAGTSAPATSAAATSAATSAAASTEPADDSAAPGGAGTAECSELLQKSTATLTAVGDAGFDYAKAGAALTKGAAEVRAEARKVGGEAGTAGERVATQLEAAAKAAPAAKDDPQPYVEAQKNVGEALVTLAQKCKVG